MLGLREATGFKVEIEVETVEEFKKVAVDKPESSCWTISA